MAEYIERERAKKVLGFGAGASAAAALDKVPTADVVEVRHGRWVKMDTTGIAAKESVWNCSACEYPVGIWTVGSNYCPNCGARMDGEKDG